MMEPASGDLPAAFEPVQQETRPPTDLPNAPSDQHTAGNPPIPHVAPGLADFAAAAANEPALDARAEPAASSPDAPPASQVDGVPSQVSDRLTAADCAALYICCRTACLVPHAFRTTPWNRCYVFALRRSRDRQLLRCQLSHPMHPPMWPLQ